MFKYILITLLILVSCQSQSAQKDDNSADNKVDLMSNTNANAAPSNTNEIVESFSDDSNVGVADRNKIEIVQFKAEENYTVKIKFSSLTEKKEWKLKQTFEFEKFDTTGLDTKLEDFNNDGLKDVTYVSALAGRGANDVRRLFIYDKKRDELVYIKNSEEYPNLLYNKRLNSLTAQRFYGATITTDFIRIHGNILKEFAQVKTVGKERIVYLIDKNGKETILRKYKLNEEEPFDRFSNYNPLEYENYDEKL